MHFDRALQMTRNFAAQHGYMLGDLRGQVLHEPEGSWSFEFDDPVDPKRMLWAASVFPGGEVRIFHLPTDVRLSEKPTAPISKLKRWLRKIPRALVLLMALTMIATSVWRIFWKAVVGGP